MKRSLLALVFLAFGTTHATLVEWSVSQGGNGHFREAVAVGQPLT